MPRRINVVRPELVAGSAARSGSMRFRREARARGAVSTRIVRDQGGGGGGGGGEGGWEFWR